MQKKLSYLILVLILPVFAFSYLNQSNKLTTSKKKNLTISEQKIENLSTFAKLFGYVRYFHPSDESEKLDWDKFAIYGAKQVENATNMQELQIILKELFQPIAPSIQIVTTGEKNVFDIKSITPNDVNKNEVVSWQHRGLGAKKRSVYRSVRLNRMVENAVIANFGNAKQTIDAEKYQGKKIKLEAAVKMKSGALGTGQLWLRIDRPNKKRGFFSNMDDRPITANEWTTYSIEGVVDEDASSINFGCFLSGKGGLWVDNFSLSIKNDKGVWEKINVENTNFEKKSLPSKKPKDWNTRGEGYKFEVTKDEKNEGLQSLNIYTESKMVGALALFDKQIEIGEFIEKEIGNGLTAIIPLALYSHKKQTYPSPKSGAFEQLEQAIIAGMPADISGNNLHSRLGISISAWNVFQHFYPYFDVVEVDWQAELIKSLENCYKNKDEYDFLGNLRELVAALKDGHGRVYQKGMKKESMIPPFKWEIIENQLVVTNVVAEALELEKGDIILKVDGKTADDFLNYHKKYISAATDGWMNYRLSMQSMRGETDTKMELLVKKADGKEVNYTVERSITIGEYYELEEEEEFEYKKMKGNIYNINLSKIEYKTFKKILPELQKANGIVFDLRGYPNSNHEILQHLTKEDLMSARWNVPQIIYPDMENIVGWGTDGRWEMKPKQPFLSTKSVFIIGGGAISYAESFMGIVEAYDLAPIIGQPTAGTNGNVNPTQLLGGYGMSWTGMKVLKHDSTQHHGIGILPDIVVERTVEGVLAGKDEFLEAAIVVLKE